MSRELCLLSETHVNGSFQPHLAINGTWLEERNSKGMLKLMMVMLDVKMVVGTEPGMPMMETELGMSRVTFKSVLEAESELVLWDEGTERYGKDGGRVRKSPRKTESLYQIITVCFSRKRILAIQTRSSQNTKPQFSSHHIMFVILHHHNRFRENRQSHPRSTR